jgi:hypothetical protein
MTYVRGYSNWKEARERSRIPRVNWRRLLGKNLSTWLYQKFSDGWTPKRCIAYLNAVLKNEHDRVNLPLDKAMENMKISVSARWSEFNRKKIYPGVRDGRD